jgi:NTE family protein
VADAPEIHIPPARSSKIQALGAQLELTHRLPKPIYYALSGGGSHGAIQWGSLQALAETDVEPDALIGTSAGALTGSVVAEDPGSGINRLAYVWAQLNVNFLLGENWLTRKLVANARRIALIDNSAEFQTFRRIYSARTFSELNLPFSAVATDLATGRATVFNEGDLLPALLASSAIPGILPPVEINGRLYCDGLASANLPALQAVEQGAKSIVVLDTGAPTLGEVDTSPTKIASRVAAILSKNQRTRQLTDAAQNVPVVVMPTPNELGGALNFTESMSAAAQAYEEGRRFLTELALSAEDALTPGLYGPVLAGEPNER